MSENSEIVIYFMFFALLVGTVTSYTLSRVNIGLPYTVVLFVLGMVIARWSIAFDMKIMGESIDQWSGISPHLILYVFLPALLFGEAMNLNIHDVKLCFGSAAVLAGPGAIFGTALVSLIGYYVFPYNWSFDLCCAFGAILCATDPVAVVALLKEVGATPRITMLVTLEALMNDGAALVLYNLFYSRLLIEEGDIESDTLSIFVYFIKVIFISPLLGFAFGLVVVAGFALTNQSTNHVDIVIQQALTLTCAYLSFFIAEYSLGVSGVLCCCSAGLIISWLGPSLILEHNTMHSVWNTFEWIGNTLIFLLAGLVFGKEIRLTLDVVDISLIFATYAFLHIIRGSMLTMFYGVLHSGIYGLDRNECLFLTWGGLRGAVSMALALALRHSASDGLIDVSERDGSRLFIIVGGVATLTLIINATTSQRMLNWLGLVEEDSAAVRTMQHYARKHIYRAVLQLVRNLKEEMPGFDHKIINRLIRDIRKTKMNSNVGSHGEDYHHGTHTDMMEAYAVPIHGQLSDHYLHKHRVGMHAISNDEESEVKSQELDFCDDESCTSLAGVDLEDDHTPACDLSNVDIGLLSHIRLAFLEVLRSNYWKHIEDGKLPRKGIEAILLLFSVDFAKDFVQDITLMSNAHENGACMSDWKYIEKFLNRSTWVTGLIALCIDWIFERFSILVFHCGFTRNVDHFATNIASAVIQLREENYIYILGSFIDSHVLALKTIPLYLSEEEVGCIVYMEFNCIFLFTRRFI